MGCHVDVVRMYVHNLILREVDDVLTGGLSYHDILRPDLG